MKLIGLSNWVSSGRRVDFIGTGGDKMLVHVAALFLFSFFFSFLENPFPLCVSFSLTFLLLYYFFSLHFVVMKYSRRKCDILLFLQNEI